MDATVVAGASDGDEGDHRRHLLETGSEILPYPESPWRPQPPGADAKPEQQKPQRVASLDVFRGLTVAVSRTLTSSALPTGLYVSLLIRVPIVFACA